MNFGHGGLGFAPGRARSRSPVAEYSHGLQRVDAHRLRRVADDGLGVLADKEPVTSNIAVKAAMHFFDMLTSPFYGSENTTTESVAIAATNCLPLLP